MRSLVSNALIGFVASIAVPCHGEQCRVASPDGSLVVVVSDEGGLHYRTVIDGVAVITKSRLGLLLSDDVALGPDAAIQHTSASQHDGSWENHFGKRRHVRDRWNQIRITFQETRELPVQLSLIVRAYDDGVAFRYELRSGSEAVEFVIGRELTEFCFAGDYRCWAGTPSNCAENTYPETRLSRIPATSAENPKGPYLSVLPLLVETPAANVAIAEADLRDWAGMFLAGTGKTKVVASLAPRDDGNGCVASRTPRVSPWRVLMIGRQPGDLVGSDLIANLSTPCQIADTSWIRPGVCAWDPWWTGINPYLPQHTEVYSRGDTRSHKEYIDLAAEMGWPYQLVDWFWYQNMTSYSVRLNHGPADPGKPVIDFEKSEPHINMPELLEYAKARGVRLIIWIHADDLNTYGIEKGLALFSSWGAAGVKVDFLNSDSQQTVAWAERVLQTAARHRLLVDFHGVYKATGLARTWPNYITQEGVLGNEYNKLDERCTPEHTVTLPFTRGLLGPMDFTPGGFLNRHPDRWKKTAPAEVMGTRARQLAMTVVYESPLLVLCDSPKNYRGQPGVEFFRGLPTVWDETVVLSAEVAKSVVLARRSGKQWWIAAMNGPDASVFEVPLKFLGPGTWQLRSFADGDLAGRKAEAVEESVQSVSNAETIRVELAPAGGFAGVFLPSGNNQGVGER